MEDQGQEHALLRDHVFHTGSGQKPRRLDTGSLSQDSARDILQHLEEYKKHVARGSGDAVVRRAYSALELVSIAQQRKAAMLHSSMVLVVT